MAAASAALLPAGCLVGPNFRRPDAPATAAYLPEGGGPPGSDAADAVQRAKLGEQIPARWWSLFHDPRLDETLRTAIASNHTVAASRATLAQAQEAIVEARAALLPRVDAAGSFRRAGSGSAGTANLFSVGPNVSFSIDAFGGIRRQVEEASALAEERRYELAAAYLTLTGNSVSEAITIATSHLQIATVEEVIRNDEKNFDLVQRSFQAGKVAKSDVLSAQAQLESDRTQLPNLRQQLQAARHALAILTGRTPAEWTPPDFDIEELKLPTELPLSLPSELVRQRPDILAAEAELHADSAAIGVATADMYPSITLSSSLAQTSFALADLLTKASRTWAVGADVDAPLYRGGALGAQRRAAIDAYDAQLEIYKQTVLTAFGQVADTLTAIDQDNALVAASKRATDIAAEALRLQRSSYTAGKTSALQLIVSENLYSQAILGYARARGQRMQDTAQLFVAAGGGWWSDDAMKAEAEASAAPHR